MRNKSTIWVFLIGGSILVCLLIAVLAFFYFNNIMNQDIPTIPIVSITEVVPEGTVVTNQHVIVFGQAQDPDGIIEVQLWVNGAMVTSQINPSTGQSAPIDTSQAWIPTGAGNYLFVLHAIDAKGFVGQSEPVAIQAAERLFTYEVASGDTIDIIADHLGTTSEDIRERNPDIEDVPVPGTSIYVSPVLPSEGGEDMEEEEVPHVDPPAPLGTPRDETPAEPASPPWWSYLPLPNGILCAINPDWCAIPLSEGERITPPTNVIATPVDPCGVVVSWEDTSENEIGFRLYRTRLGALTGPELVASFLPSLGSGTRMSFVEEPPFGRFTYAVTAYDGPGEVWSPPSETIEILCLTLETPDTISVSVEALEMTVRDPFDRLYCYASLAGSPFERVPHGSSFIELDSGSWNIAEHFSGSNKRTIRIHRLTPLEIQAECLGWQGGTLVNLGRFSRSHPPEEWDGRLLTAGPPDSSFTVTYRINPVEPEEYETGYWAIEDASIPPPFNVNPTDLYYRCTGEPHTCREVLGPAIKWMFSVPSWISEPIYFKIFVRRADEDTPRHYYTQPDNFPAAPQILVEECGSPVYYSVKAVVGHDPFIDEEIESPLSEELEVPPSCPQLEISLGQLHVYSTPDGDPGTDFCLSDCGPEVEAYGRIQVGSKRIRWNNHCDHSSGAGCISGGRSYTALRDGSILNWANEYLNTGSGGGTNHNTFRIPIPEDRNLSFGFSFYDHDHRSPDDFWCGWSSPRAYSSFLPARSQEEWLAIDQDVEVDSPDGRCLLTLHVRGVP